MQSLKCKCCQSEFKPSTKRQVFCTRKCQVKHNGAKNNRERSKKHYSKLKPFLGHLLSLKKFNREKLSVEFLEELFHKQKGLCAISKVPLTHIRGEGVIQTNVSIDRKDNRKGYTEDNVQLVCNIVNRMKSDQTQEQLEFWCERILNKNAEWKP